MTRSKIGRPNPPRKPPTVVGAFPSKLLHDCPRCGRPVFACRMAGFAGPVDVEVLETPSGNVALQSEIGSDVLTAVVVSSPRTYYRQHAQHCRVPAFSKPPGSGKVRP